MSEVDDARLRALAGVSLNTPQREYHVTGCSFGDATLRRDEGWTRWEVLTLTLRASESRPHPSSAARPAHAVEFGFSRSRFDLMGTYHSGDGPSTAALPPGTQSLIVDHALLSNASWLTGGAPEPEGLSEVTRSALEKLRLDLAGRFDLPRRCTVCKAIDEKTGVGSRQAHNEQIDYYNDILHRLGLFSTRPQRRPPVEERDCEHGPLRREALQALFTRHPELAFEALGVLVPSSRCERFMLNPQRLPELFQQWLPRPSRAPTVGAPRALGVFGDAAPATGAVYIWPESVAPPPPPPPPSASERAQEVPPRRVRATKVDEPKALAKEPKPQATELKPQAKEPKPQATEPKPQVKEPKPLAKESKPQVKESKPQVKELKPQVSAPPDARAAASTTNPLAGQLVMSSELRALGHDAAAVKRLIKEGALERVDFGWYRWKA